MIFNDKLSETNNKATSNKTINFQPKEELGEKCQKVNTNKNKRINI